MFKKWYLLIIVLAVAFVFLAIGYRILTGSGGSAEVGLFKAEVKPQKKVELPDALEKIVQEKSANQTEPKGTYTFWLTRDEGSSITIGPCPSEKCLEVILDKLEYKNGITTQFFHLKGESLGVKKSVDKSGPKPMYRVGLYNPIRIKGAGIGLNYSRPGMLIKLDLHKNSLFEMFTKYADIKFTVVDLRVDSLKIKLEIYPPSEPL